MADTKELYKLPATEIAAGVKSRRFTAKAAAESAMARIAQVNPSLNAVIEEFADESLAAAAAVDKAIADGKDPGVLAGVPVTVKVNVDQIGHATTNGLRLQKDLIAKVDNPVVANMKKAGAVIVGRTNTPAFSLRWFTRNSLHGATKNPRDPKLTPGGSSGGAASAVAAGMCAVSHGTDIAGSIRYPAYACGIHGLRPTFGRIPAMNYSSPERNIGGQVTSVSGPLARTVGDLRIAFDAMSQPDLGDSWYVPAPASTPALPKKAALCISPEGLDVEPAVADALRLAAEILKAAGWTVEERACPPLREAVTLQLRLWSAEFRSTGLAGIDKEGDPDASFVFRQLLRHAGDSNAAAALDALQRRAALIREWQNFLAEYPVTLLPVSGRLPFADHLDVQSEAAFDDVLEAQMTMVALPLIGVPALTVSLATDGAPVGVQLVGPRYREDVLFGAGEILEQARPIAGPVDPAP